METVKEALAEKVGAAAAGGTQPAPPVEVAPIVSPAVAAAAATTAVTENKDIGTWKYTPWKGLPMWTHPNGETSFDREYVRKLRKMR